MRVGVPPAIGEEIPHCKANGFRLVEHDGVGHRPLLIRHVAMPGDQPNVKRQYKRLVGMLDDIERLRALLIAQRFDAVASHGARLEASFNIIAEGNPALALAVPAVEVDAALPGAVHVARPHHGHVIQRPHLPLKRDRKAHIDRVRIYDLIGELRLGAPRRIARRPVQSSRGVALTAQETGILARGEHRALGVSRCTIKDMLEIPADSVSAEQGHSGKCLVVERVQTAALPRRVGDVVEDCALPAVALQAGLAHLVRRACAHMLSCLSSPAAPGDQRPLRRRRRGRAGSGRRPMRSSGRC